MQEIRSQTLMWLLEVAKHECMFSSTTPSQFQTWLEVEVSQHLNSLLHYTSYLTEAKCHKAKHYLVAWLKQAKIDIRKLSL